MPSSYFELSPLWSVLSRFRMFLSIILTSVAVGDGCSPCLLLFLSRHKEWMMFWNTYRRMNVLVCLCFVPWVTLEALSNLPWSCLEAALLWAHPISETCMGTRRTSVLSSPPVPDKRHKLYLHCLSTSAFCLLLTTDSLLLTKWWSTLGWNVGIGNHNVGTIYVFVIEQILKKNMRLIKSHTHHVNVIISHRLLISTFLSS